MDPITMAALGSAASGLGSFASGLISGGGKSFKNMRSEYEMAREYKLIDQDDQLAFAKKAGLHPLAALGVMPSGGTPAFSVGDSTRGVDLEQMGQGVSRVLKAGRAKIENELDELALEKAQLSNDFLRTQIAGAQKQIANTSPPVPVMGQSLSGISSSKLSLRPSDLVKIVKDEQISKASNDSGKTAGSHAAWKSWDLGDGQSMEAPWGDEGWAEAIGELPVWYKYPKMAEALVKRNKKSLNRVKDNYKWAFKKMYKKSPAYKAKKYFSGKHK